MKNIYINGRVYTVTGGSVEAFVEEDGKFIYVGGSDKALSYKEEDSNIIDLEGKFVTAGFIDSHIHISSLGETVNMVNLEGAKSIEEIIERGINHKTEDNWIIGYGWNQDDYKEKRFVNRYDLDRISLDKPVVYKRACHHVYVVNSKALSMLNLPSDYIVEGGQIDLDENGKPLGILREKAVKLLYDSMETPSVDNIKRFIVDGIKCCNKQGITTVHTDDFYSYDGFGYRETMDAFTELEAEGLLTAKVYQQSRFTDIDLFRDFTKYKEDMKTTLYRIGPLKLMGDGSLGARTAALNSDYNDDKGNQGILIIDQDEMDAWVTAATEANMPIALHAIGDRTMCVFLDSIEKIVPTDSKIRHGIVHAQLTDKDIMKRMRDNSVMAYIQSIFLDYDSNIVEDRVGVDRAKETYNFKYMRDLGINVSDGSDAPVEFPSVLKGIQLAVTRTSFRDGAKPFLTEEAVSVEEGIRGFTIGGAYSSYEENVKGSIEAGKEADFVVLSRDILNIDSSTIKDTVVEKTYLNGKLVYSI